MAQRPLKQSIFRLVLGLIVFTVITIFINVWSATIDQAQDRLNRDLSIAQNVLERVLQSREEMLFIPASVLTADFGFKQAVASGDKGTIDSALFNHGQRINADLMALVSLDGTTVTSYPAVLKNDQPFPFPSVIENINPNGGSSTLMMLEQQLYQVMVLTINAPRPIAIALVGFKLDESILSELYKITKLETTLQVFNEGLEKYKISTLPDPTLATALSQVGLKPSWLSITVTNDIPFVSKQFTLTEDLGHQTVITLSEDTRMLFADLISIQFNITAIGLAAALLATLLAALFSNKISQPLSMLGSVAKRIAKGDYSKDIDIPSNNKEVSLLSEAITSMQINVRNREHEIIFQARHDSLTSLFNRHYIETLLEKKFSDKEEFLAIGINIFGFRGINDIFGYHNGDLCLQELARRLTEFKGLAARLTGGELLWVPTSTPSDEDLAHLKFELEKPINTDGVAVELKVVIGLIHCPNDAKNAEDVFKRLNIVLDEAQVSRKFILSFEPELEARYSRRLAIISELKHTLEHASDELTLNYQAKLGLNTNKITHVEALIRWNNANLGFVSPEDFIAVAEQAGFIEQVTSWVVHRAIEDAARLHAEGIDVSIAINLSAKDIMNPGLLPTILEQLEEKGLAADRLSFEITEGDLVNDHAKAIRHLQAFRDKGFEIAIDDFGTGYSSMAYLQNLPVNTLKVDKSFVLNLHDQQGDQKIVKTVISLAHSFDMNVVAEGVENLESLTLLSNWGCELAQGYYICRPIPINDFIDWYSKNSNTKWL